MAPKIEGDGEGLGFLSLPREIRDRIYESVLDFEETTPGKPDEDPERQNYGLCSHPCFFPQRILSTSSGSLLRCNRQIFAELSQTISRCDITYKLEVLLKGDWGKDERYDLNPLRTLSGGLYPTWTKLPASLEHLKYLDINITFHNSAILYGDRALCSPNAMDLLGVLGSLAPGPRAAEPSNPYPSMILREHNDIVHKDLSMSNLDLAIRHSIAQSSPVPPSLHGIAITDILLQKLRNIFCYWNGVSQGHWNVGKIDQSTSPRVNNSVVLDWVPQHRARNPEAP